MFQKRLLLAAGLLLSLSIAAYSLFVKRPFANFNNNQISHNGSIFVHPTLNLNIESALPPFIDEETHIVYTVKYKLSACLLPKVMSTTFTAVLCYLHNPEAFVKANRTITNELWWYRFCGDSIESYNVAEFNQSINRNQDYQMFTMVRDPIDRFLAAFADKCYFEPQNSPDPLGCYNCNGDIECFINKMEKRLWGFVYGTVELRVIDEHVMPQTWNCGMKKFMNQYKIFRYTNPKSLLYDNFIKELMNMFNKSNVPQSNIDYVVKSLTASHSPHSTSGKSQRTVYEDVLRHKPYLLKKLINIYYYDYIFFGFEIPDINKF